MERTRFEIELRKDSSTGKMRCRIFDDYWDRMDYGTFEIGHPEQIDLKAFRELRDEIAALRLMSPNTGTLFERFPGLQYHLLLVALFP